MKASNDILNKIGTVCTLFLFFSLFLVTSTYAQSPETWTASGNWTAPVGVTSVTVECWGAGGNGGAGGKNAAGGGGGGGAYSIVTDIPVVPGNIYAVNVGVGGAVTLTDRDSWFSSVGAILAKGGNDGAASAGKTPGAGGAGGLSSQGVGSGFSGGDGADGTVSDGGGGGSSAGDTSNGVTSTGISGATAPTGGGNGGNGGAGANGNNGSTPGGGGGGSGALNGGIGGTGANGQVILTYTAVTNNAPVVSVDALQTICESDQFILSSSTNITDGDGDTQELVITITNGTLTLDANSMTVSGDGTSNITITNDANASLSNINNALEGAVFSPDVPGTGNVDISSNDGVATVSNNFDINVIANPSAADAGTNQTICASETATLDAISPAVGTGAWTLISGPSSNLSQIDILTSNTAIFAPAGGAGVYTLTWTNSNSPCSSSSANVTITVNSAPSKPTISADGPLTFCNGGTVRLTSSSPSDNTWSTAEITQFIDVTTSGSYTVTVTSGGCESLPSDATVVTVVPGIPGNPTAITGNTNPLPSTGGLVYTTTSTDADPNGYTWTLPVGWSGTSTTNSITVTSGAEGQDGVIEVWSSNVCGTSASSATLTVTPTPAAQPPTITLGTLSPDPTCENTIVDWPYSATSDDPDLYSVDYDGSANAAGFVDVTDASLPASPIQLNVPLSVPEGSYSGVLRVKNSTTGLPSVGYPFSFTVNGRPADIIGITPVNPNTQGYIFTITPIANATSYSWSVPANWSITAGATTNEITVTSGGLADDGNVSVQAIYACGTSSATSLPVTVEDVTDHTGINCTNCHTFHNATGSALTNAAAASDLCIGCHNAGSIAKDLPFLPTDQVNSTGNRNSHSWDATAINPLYDAVLPTTYNELAVRIVDGKISCATCHDQHNGNAETDYLRVPNVNDAICKDCHAPRNVGTYVQSASNRGSHPVGVTYDEGKGGYNLASASSLVANNNDQVNCTTCHGVHDVNNTGTLTTDGNLLKMTNDVDLCKDCHNYPGHNGFDCLDCHEVHNTVDGIDGNNIFMIKDVVNGSPVVLLAESGANSFVDTDGTYDGICEVCHTTTTHHRSDGSLPTHDDASDKREQNCVGCHFHNAGFETPTGPQTCTSCHSSSQSGGRGGAAQIVGAGSEFDPTYSSRHTASGIGIDPTNEECEACHFDSGATHPTSEMMLKNVDASAVWSGDLNVYCVQCHDGDPPAGTTFPGGDAKYDKSLFASTSHDYGTNSCQICHNNHGSPNPNINLLKQTSNYNECNACHSNTGDASTMSTDAWTSAGNSHAWNVNAVNGTYDAVAPTDPTMNARLDGSNVVCSTCHDPHDNSNTKFLVNDNSSDGMCKDCHSPRNVGRYADDIVNNKGSHPVGLTYTAGGDYVDPAPTLSSTQVGLVNGKIECSSCHSAHNATTTDGSLLRETMTSATCKECHNYQPHQGFDCLDCHQSHNTDNIMLVKSTVNGSTVVFNSQGTTASPVQALEKSFADGDGTYDGICEVCHTTTLYHKTSDDGVDHNDGKNCMTCHAHNDPTTSFPNGSCHDCHEDPTPGNQLYPNTGAHDKHAGAQYGYTCSVCHFGYGDGGPSEGAHSNGAINVEFEPGSLAFPFGADAGLTPTYDPGTKTCDNIYCHSNGQNAYQGTDAYNVWSKSTGSESATFATTPAWDAPVGTINDCDFCHAGNGVMTPPYTFGTSDGIVFDPPLTGAHGTSSHAKNAKNLNGVAAWTSTQCFWCHNAQNGSWASTGMLQGTYGTSLHVDGQVHFNPNSYQDQTYGTMVNGPDVATPYSNSFAGTHCGDRKTCW
ncbi:cytochrome c3 family protein [Carboxylicivirga marina]|uniref:cytochrome c3 family protein n=1 Tax=Carboxylicivirga marina TaxID=2800988 RepID=UPI0025915E53|nr:CxxxxCH/CxxCH domain-containing protein [uncultured Carboxylicivirga sp.]